MNLETELHRIIRMDEQELYEMSVQLQCLSIVVNDRQKTMLAQSLVREEKPPQPPSKKKKGYTNYPNEVKDKAIHMLKDGLDMSFIQRETGVARNTLYTWKGRIRKEQQHEQETS